MPLLALDTERDNTVVDLTAITDQEWSSIWRARTGARLRCRECRTPVVAKRITTTGLRFFAHAHATPGCPAHGESARHLELKRRAIDAFRAAGWRAEAEAAGPGWRADVLALGPEGQRIAVEVQLASIAADEVDERTGRHQASGLSTLWVLDGRRPSWATRFATVLLDGGTDVVDSVVRPASARALAVAAPASFELLIERVVQGRLSPVPRAATGRVVGVEDPVMRYFQLDGCVDAHLARAQSVTRAPRTTSVAGPPGPSPAERAAMAESLSLFREWFATQTQWRCWFGARAMRDPVAAARDVRWSQEIGVAILVGGFAPRYVLALAEPRLSSPRRDRRVRAWVSGRVLGTDPTGFAVVYTPHSLLDLADIPLTELKPYRRTR